MVEPERSRRRLYHFPLAWVGRVGAAGYPRPVIFAVKTAFEAVISHPGAVARLGESGCLRADFDAFRSAPGPGSPFWLPAGHRIFNLPAVVRDRDNGRNKAVHADAQSPGADQAHSPGTWFVPYRRRAGAYIIDFTRDIAGWCIKTRCGCEDQYRPPASIRFTSKQRQLLFEIQSI